MGGHIAVNVQSPPVRCSHAKVLPFRLSVGTPGGAGGGVLAGEDIGRNGDSSISPSLILCNLAKLARGLRFHPTGAASVGLWSRRRSRHTGLANLFEHQAPAGERTKQLGVRLGEIEPS